MKNKSKIVIGILLLTTFTGCSGTKKQTDCVENGKASDFWKNYELPKVEGAEYCRENTERPNEAFISFVHYRDSSKYSIDFLKPYQDELSKKGWNIEGINSDKTSFIYANKNGKRMIFKVGDCFKKTSDYQACTEVSMNESNEPFVKKK